jgi:hypothetical protein
MVRTFTSDKSPFSCLSYQAIRYVLEKLLGKRMKRFNTFFPFLSRFIASRRTDHISLYSVRTLQLLACSCCNSIYNLIVGNGNGLCRESIEQVIAQLNPVGGPPKVGALSLAYTLAMLEYTNVDDLDWLRRSFAMFGDVLDDMIKDSWVYKEWTQEATEQGVMQGMQQALVSMVQIRFAPLASLAKERSALLKTPEELQDLIVQIVLAQDEKDVLRLLLADSDKKAN